MKSTYYGRNFVVFAREDGYYTKAQLIKKYLEWASNKNQSIRLKMDQIDLQRLPDNLIYDYETPQWTGHAVHPDRVRADNNMLYRPAFISNVIDWK